MSLNHFARNTLVLDSLQDEVSNFLHLFENNTLQLLNELEDPVQSLAKRVFSSGGKRIRPKLCFHCCFGSSVSTLDLIKASAVIEIVHIATLVHDDILDGASIRRGKSAIHTEIGNHSSILLGDALFSYALELATEFSSSFICKVVSKATRKTCSGEIRQTFCRGNFSLGLNDYLSIIQGKTGELFRAACEVGTHLAGFPMETTIKAGNFGSSLGIIYQIYDDLVDSFGNPRDINKSLGSDFESGKVTLPLLLLLKEVNDSESANLLSILQQRRDIPQNRKLIVELFGKYHILNKCIEELNSKVRSATAYLNGVEEENLSSNLMCFLSSFSYKLKNLNNLRTSNFLAV